MIKKGFRLCRGSTVVEHPTHSQKIKGLNPAKRENDEKADLKMLFC